MKVQDRVQIVTAAVEDCLPRLRADLPFDLVLADPPYGGGWESRLLSELPWDELLSPGGHFCLEWGTQKSKVDELPGSVPFLVKIREKNYGDSILTTYRREAQAGG